MSMWMTGGAPPSAARRSSGSTVISPSWRFQYVHMGRSRTTSPVGVRTSIVSGQAEQRPEALGPRAGRDDDLLDGDPPCARLDARTVPSSATRSRSPRRRSGRARPRPGLALEALDRVEVEGEAALVLVQQPSRLARASRGRGLHVRVDLARPRDQLRAVADALLPLVRRGEVASFTGAPSAM